MGLVNTRQIIEQRDAAAMCALDADDMMDVLIELWCSYYHARPLSELNAEQLTFFLCMELENTCQADSILNLAEEEDIFFRIPRMHQALLELGAPRTAEALRQFMDLLPDGTFENRRLPDWNWFSEDQEREKRIGQIESQIADYPDGHMADLYHRAITADIAAAEKLLDV